MLAHMDRSGDKFLRLNPAAWQVADPSTSDTQWAHRQRELLNRRLYLKDFWYAAGAHRTRLSRLVLALQ